jgi:histidinol phosphatase-like enzyme
MDINTFSDSLHTLSGYFEQNEFMDKYVELLKSCNTTHGEKHHAIPVCYYRQKYKCKSRKEAEKLANADTANILIQMTRQQHALAHFYLCKCCTDKILFGRLLVAFKFLFGNPSLIQLDDIDESDIIAQIELATYENHKDCFGKPVLCIETNIVYPNISAANEAMGKPRYGCATINSACVNRDGLQSALGYHWCFYGENNKVPEHLVQYLGTNQQIEYKNEGKKVCCVETGEIFKSMYEAGKHFNSSRHMISECCKKSWKSINGFHFCFEADRDTFVIKPKPGMSDEAKKNISEGTIRAMAALPESAKQRIREKNKQFWAENKLHYYNNGIEEARLPSCPEGWIAGRLEKHRTKGKPVYCVELNITYKNAVTAANELGINRKSIGNCATGKAKTAGGYTWRYA